MMNSPDQLDACQVGFDIPAKPGMDVADIQTPCLVIDLDALEHNIRKMGEYAAAHGMRHRVHGKMHKSVDIAKLQQRLGGAVGICCQKVSEAEVFARGGITDILISNQVRDPAKITRLAQLPALGATIVVCVDDIDNVADLSAAAQQHGTSIGCLVEMDVGAGRCGVRGSDQVVAIAKAIHKAEGLTFDGLQAYHGPAQHLPTFAERRDALDHAVIMVRAAVAALHASGLRPRIVSGGGTGSYRLEAESGVYNELQCGSYAFMDAAYGRVLGKDGNRLDHGEWQNDLFILTQIMSRARTDMAICDAGLKSQSIDSGLPVVYGRDDVVYVNCSDEHGVITDPKGVLKVGEKLQLVPGHCDPTVNIHDWFVGVRHGKVEVLWPVSARGKSF